MADSNSNISYYKFYQHELEVLMIEKLPRKFRAHINFRRITDYRLLEVKKPTKSFAFYARKHTHLLRRIVHFREKLGSAKEGYQFVLSTFSWLLNNANNYLKILAPLLPSLEEEEEELPSHLVNLYSLLKIADIIPTNNRLEQGLKIELKPEGKNRKRKIRGLVKEENKLLAKFRYERNLALALDNNNIRGKECMEKLFDSVDKAEVIVDLMVDILAREDEEDEKLIESPLINPLMVLRYAYLKMLAHRNIRNMHFECLEILAERIKLVVNEFKRSFNPKVPAKIEDGAKFSDENWIKYLTMLNDIPPVLITITIYNNDPIDILKKYNQSIGGKCPILTAVIRGKYGVRKTTKIMDSFPDHEKKAIYNKSLPVETFNFILGPDYPQYIAPYLTLFSLQFRYEQRKGLIDARISIILNKARGRFLTIKYKIPNICGRCDICKVSLVAGHCLHCYISHYLHTKPVKKS